MQLNIETEQEIDGRWIAEILEIPGVLVYGLSRADAIAKAIVLAGDVLSERLEFGEDWPSTLNSAL